MKAQSEYIVRCIHVFCTFGADPCAQSVLINKISASVGKFIRVRFGWADVSDSPPHSSGNSRAQNDAITKERGEMERERKREREKEKERERERVRATVGDF